MTERAIGAYGGVKELFSVDGPERSSCIAEKISAIIQSFAGRSEQSLTKIAQFTGLPLSTTHRLVSQMATCGLVERGENGRYRLGSKFAQLASSRNGPVDPRLSIGGALEDLAFATGHPSRLGVLRACLTVSYFERSTDLRCGPCVPGPSLPASSTASGRAILAHLPRHVLESHVRDGLPDTPETAMRAAQLHHELSSVRRQGIAALRDGGQAGGVWAVAAPVFGRNDRAVGALELTIPGFMRGGAVSAVPALVIAARNLSRWLADPFNRLPAEPDLLSLLRAGDASDTAGSGKPVLESGTAV